MRRLTNRTADAPLHPTAQYLAAYYRDYARHFGIYDKIAYNAAVKSVTRDEASSKWLVWLGDDEQPRAFDKVVFATGTEHKPKYPKIEGLDKFGGTLIHGQAYKKYAQRHSSQSVETKYKAWKADSIVCA